MKASGLFAAALALCLVQSVLCQSEAEETNVRPNPQEGQRQPPQSPARQRPQPGIGGLLSGLLGTITKTADVSDCPGKCIHALASLMCDTVLEEVQCPSASMRCCVEREKPNRKPANNKPRTTTEATTTTKRRRRTTTPPKTTPRTTITTTKKPEPTTKRTTNRVKPTTYSVDRSSAPGNVRSHHSHGGGGERGGQPLLTLPARPPVTQRTGTVDGFDHSGHTHGVRRMDTTSSRSPAAPAAAPSATAGAGGLASLPVLVTLLTLTLTFGGASRTA